jgi:hypothetical protein
MVHGGVVSTTDTATLLVALALPASLARVEVSTSEMRCSIIVGTVNLLVTTVLTASEKLFVG